MTTRQTTDQELSGRKKESFRIFDDIADTYDGLNRLLSMGIDIHWRNQMLKHLPQGKVKALDLATGTGDVALTLVKSSQVESVKGLDMSQNMVALGKRKVVKKKLDHKIQLQVGDGVHIPEKDNAYDLVTISFGIRNFPDVPTSLKNCLRVLRPGGKLMIMEFSLPKNRFFRWLYFLYFRHILPLIGNIISGHKDAYTYLNESVEDFPYGEEFAGLIRDAGFKDIKLIPQTFGIATLYVATKA